MLHVIAAGTDSRLVKAAGARGPVIGDGSCDLVGFGMVLPVLAFRPNGLRRGRTCRAQDVFLRIAIYLLHE